MTFDDLKKHISEKFFFSRTLVTNVPGIIMNKHSIKFGSNNDTRVIFFFEDLFVDLYNETVLKIGKEKTSELWYRIGKDIGTRYFLFSKRKNFSESKINSVLNFIFEAVYASGLTFVEEVVPGSSPDFFSVRGRYPLISRKTNDGSVLSGILSGILSYVYKENIEADCFDPDPELTKVIASKKIKFIYKPDFSELSPHRDYFNLNKVSFREFHGRKISSLDDLMKFGKISFEKNPYGWNFLGKILFPSEVGLFGIIFNNYLKEGIIDILRNVYVSSSEKFFYDLLSDKACVSDRVQFMLNFLSSFGWGVPSITRGNEISIRFLHPPFSRYGCLDRAFCVNGFLNAVYGGKFFLVRAVNSEFIYSNKC